MLVVDNLDYDISEVIKEESTDISLEQNRSSKEDMINYFEEASELYGVPTKLLMAIAKAESNFNPRVVSYVGAMGVMQLMPNTARGLGVQDPFNARDNILGGAKYIKSMLDMYDGNIEFALAAYNAGPGNVNKYKGIPPFEETQKYVPKVMGYYLGGEIEINGAFYEDVVDISQGKNVINIKKRTIEDVLSVLNTIEGYDTIKDIEELYGLLGEEGINSSMIGMLFKLYDITDSTVESMKVNSYD